MPPMYCEIALPIPLRSLFTYQVPASLQGVLAPGSRVLVPFRKRAMVGVVVRLTSSAPEAAPEKVRPITEVLDPLPALTPQLIELGQWVAGYYLAPEGEVFRAMLPAQVELRQQREWTLTDAGRLRKQELEVARVQSAADVAELALLSLAIAKGGRVGSGQLRKVAGAESAAARLVRRGEMDSREVTLHRRSRTQKIVAWDADTEAASLTRREARVRQVLAEERGPLPLPVVAKISGVSRAAIEAMIGRGRLKSWEEPLAAEADQFAVDYTAPLNVLNEDQRVALAEIERWMAQSAFTPALLYGVTGSGKTEIYLGAIEAALAAGKSALVLVPEIALTLWIGRLCRARLGAGVAVLHSALRDGERASEWWRVRRGEARVVVGTRSAVFAPLEHLGIVIIDEEQESSYKQQESPRYHGRDVAIVRAKLEGAVALLGSATPSLESFHNARLGRYQLLQLGSRVENRPMARVEIVDLREDFRATHQTGPISFRLAEGIAAQLAQGTQSLILINRRGYSWFVTCRSCGAGISCENCSISLTYHKRRARLACHYCGFSREVPKLCPKCGSAHIYFFGAGAEQLDERLRQKFPAARIGRLDRDTVRTKHAYQQVLGDFSAGKLDILVGTQMVAKGHDFQRVTLVGVVSADSQLSLPDFRAAERTFQLLTQVAGRAGRGALPGEVLVETHYPEHYAIELAVRQDYAAFFEKEMEFRRLLHYPPFTALASVLVRDTKVENVTRWCRQLSAMLAPWQARGVKVLGPAAAPLARLKREYRFQFLLKSSKRALLGRALSELLALAQKAAIPDNAVVVDMDPLSLF